MEDANVGKARVMVSEGLYAPFAFEGYVLFSLVD
jgi:hypothetical protein